MLLVSVVSFVLVFVTGDPAVMMTPTKPGQQPDPALVETIRQQYGLDQPIPVQYVRYMGRLLQGDLGESYYFRRPVLELLTDKFPTTATLAALIMVTALLIGIPLGVIAAVRRNSLVDRAILFYSTVMISVPSFFLALVLIFFLSYQLRWFPLGGTGSLRHYVLPVISVALPTSVGYAIFLRTNMLNALSAEYARAARSKGLSRSKVNYKHVLPNALIPVVNLASLDMAYLLTGIVLIEQVFNIPGIGLQVLQAVRVRDVPVVMGSVFFGAILIGIGNLVADIITARLDPRIRLGE